MITETLTILAILTGGSALMRSLGIRGWILPAFGFIAGISTLVIVGTLLIITPLPTYPLLILILSVLLPVIYWLYLYFKGCDVSVKAMPALLVILGTVFIIGFVRYFDFVNWHTDSFFNIESATLISQLQFEFTRFANITKRLAAIPIVHSMATLSGEYYLRSFGPLLSTSTLMSLVWFFRQGTKKYVDLKSTILLSSAGLLLLITNSRYVFNTFYINGHLLFAALLLIIVGCGWLLVRKVDISPKALIGLQVLTIPVLVVTRPEAPIVVAVALLPVLLSKQISLKHRITILAALGISTIAWQGYAALRYLEIGSSVPDSVTGLIGFGIAALMAIPIISIRWLYKKNPAIFLWCAEASLWFSVVALFLWEPEILQRSTVSTIQNVVYNQGSWGYSLILLGIIFMALLIFKKFQHQIYIRFTVTTFAPISILVAYMRGGAYRVGDGDSLNRMLIHIVPLAVLYIITAVAIGKDRFRIIKKFPYIGLNSSKST